MLLTLIITYYCDYSALAMYHKVIACKHERVPVVVSTLERAEGKYKKKIEWETPPTHRLK